MINTVNHNITIDLGLATSTAPSIKIKMYDGNSHKFIFTVLENGTAYDLTGLTARMYFVKGDGTKVYQDGTLDTPAGGLISAILTTQCVSCPGYVSCELTIYGDAGELLTSASFLFYVLDLDRDDAAIASTSEFTSLTTLIVTAGQHELRIAANESQLADIVTYATVVDVTNVFTIDMLGKAIKNVKMAIADNTAKSIVVTNPTVGCEIFIELTYTDGAAITYTMSSGSALTWLTGAAPTLIDGKAYRFAFYYKATNVWHGTVVGGW